jgi:5-methylcytosine-specific restriction enzyme A
MGRKRLSTRDRARIFAAAGGVCHICGGLIQAGEAWEVSHPIPIALGGDDDDTNRRPAHKKCHRALTAQEDIPRIAKAKRVEARHLGARVAKGTIKSAGFARAPKRREIGEKEMQLRALRAQMYGKE